MTVIHKKLVHLFYIFMAMILVVIMFLDASSQSSLNEIAPLNSVPTIRSSKKISALVSDSYIFLLTESKAQKNSGSSNLLNVMQYSFATRQWKTAAEIPQGVIPSDPSLYDMHWSVVSASNSASVSGKYLFLWGITASENIANAAGALYDAEKDVWTLLPSEQAPVKRLYFRIAPVKNGFLVYGGRSRGDDNYISYNGYRLVKASQVIQNPFQFVASSVEAAIFNISQSRWMPVKIPAGWKVWHAVQWKNEIIFMLQHPDKGRYIFRYSPERQEWDQSIKVPFTVSSYGLTVPTEEGLYYFGLFQDEHSANLMRIHYLNLRNQTWIVSPVASGKIMDITLIDDKLYIFKDNVWHYKTSEGVPYLYGLWYMDSELTTWTGMELPDEITSEVKPEARFIPGTNTFVFLYVLNGELRGFISAPPYLAKQTIKLAGYQYNNLDWTGSYLAGSNCYGKQLCSGFLYDPDHEKWVKIKSEGGPSAIPNSVTMSFHQKVLIVDKINLKIYIYNVVERRWLPGFWDISTLSHCKDSFDFCYTSKELFLQCRNAVYKTDEPGHIFESVNVSSDYVNDPDQHEIQYFTNQESLFRLIGPARSLRKSDTTMHLVIERLEQKEKHFVRYLEYSMQLPAGIHVAEIYSSGGRYAVVEVKTPRFGLPENDVYNYLYIDTKKSTIVPITLDEKEMEMGNIYPYKDGIAAFTYRNRTTDRYQNYWDFGLWKYSIETKKWIQIWDSTTLATKVKLEMKIMPFKAYQWFSVLTLDRAGTTHSYVLQVNFETGKVTSIHDENIFE